MHNFFHIAVNMAYAIPGFEQVRKLGNGSTGANSTADPDAVMLEWASEIARAAAEHSIEINCSHLVEVGPGHSLGVAFCHLLAGASSVHALDVERNCDNKDAAQFIELHRRWCIEYGREADRDPADYLPGLQYSVIDSHGAWPARDNSADIVYSFFSGEHLKDPETTLSETRRVLRAGGVCMYAIDLRSHIDHAGNWLGHLYHSDSKWEAMTSRRGHWTNRLMVPEWKKLFNEKFDILEFKARRPDMPKDFKIDRVAPRFRQFSIDEIVCDYVWVVARKVQ